MEEERVGLALAKATDLRLKFSSCIKRAASGKLASPNKQNPEIKQGPNSHHQSLGQEDEVDEETERLLNIRDALESLEAQLIALQNLYHQQRYERDIALAGIDYSRRRLLQKLEEYEGKDLDVILEASAFVSKTVENNYDLLPPYPSHSPRSLVFDDDISHFQSTYKPLANGIIKTGDLTDEAKKNRNGHDQIKRPYESRSSRKGVGYFFSSAVKIVLPIFGAIYILRLSCTVPNLGNATPLKFLGMLLQQQSPEENNNSTVRCPPGKVLVMENGEARCLVKERIEVPFESVVAKPDVNYISG